jgi:rfaE bifunctional protein nucleotidyltransferase chain/domain
VVFTNGCFDILHAGHVDYLYRAREAGDALVVGLNSDRSVREIKEKGRPILEQGHRAAVLAGLGCVDFVTIFDAPDPFELILALRPNVLVKGADWPEDRIVGADQVRSYGGRVQRIAFVYSLSTSEIIRRIVEGFGSGQSR